MVDCLSRNRWVIRWLLIADYQNEIIKVNAGMSAEIIKQNPGIQKPFLQQHKLFTTKIGFCSMLRLNLSLDCNSRCPDSFPA